jgi:hypothetical protein
MILFACECGSPYMVEDQYAGGTLECTACGKGIAIPSASDPRVALVFRAGESEDGVPMLREEVERLVAAGEFTEAELIWDGTTWRPVTEVMGGGAPGGEEHAKLHLKRRDDEEEEEEGELAFDGIEPIQKVQLDEEELQQLPTKKREKKEKKRKEKKERKSRNASGVGLWLKRVFGSDPAMGPKVNVPVQIFWFLVVAFFGFRLGVGPLISKFRETPTYVVVYNGMGQEYTASLGWRRLKKDIYPNTSACFEVYVGMRETQTLTLTPKKGNGPVITSRVPMWPGGITVVNPGGKATFAQLRTGDARKEKLLHADVKRLADQIGGHQDPTGIHKLTPEAKRIAKKALVGERTDEIFTSARFRFDRSILQGDTEVIARFLKKLEERQKKTKREYDLMVFPPQRSVDFSGGSAYLDLRNKNLTRMTIWLPRKQFSIGIVTLKLKDNPKLEVSNASGRLELKMEIPQTTKFGSRSYRGNWRYFAYEEKGKWHWAWSFDGTADKAPKGVKHVSYRYGDNRKPVGPKFS